MGRKEGCERSGYTIGYIPILSYPILVSEISKIEYFERICNLSRKERKEPFQIKSSSYVYLIHPSISFIVLLIE